MSEQDKPNDGPSWQDQLTVEHIVAEPAFNELVEFASEVCLQAPGRVAYHEAKLREATKPPTADELLIRKIGVWGLRTAQEIADNSDSFTFDTGERKEDLIHPDSPITNPQWYDLELKPEVQRKIEAFGRSILDETFICLGDGGLDKAQELRQLYDTMKDRGETVTAETPEYKAALDVANWLMKRVLAIATVHEDINQDVFYHPVRLSPKFLGQFPDVGTYPTCLGLSVLISSFCEKAGIPYLHAGVAHSSSDDNRGIYSTALSQTPAHAKKRGITIPDQIQEQLNAIHDENQEHMFEDRGYHAAALIELLPGLWLQADPNFHSNIVYPLDADEPDISSVYERVKAYSELNPAFEMMIDGRMLPVTFLVELLFNKRSRAQRRPEWIQNWLTTADSISFESLADTFVKHYFFGPTKSERTAYFQENVIEATSLLKTDNPEFVHETTWENLDYLDYQAQDVIRKYVFPDAPHSSSLKRSIERCRTDPAYLARRVEDLQLAPLLYRLKIMSEILFPESTPGDMSSGHAYMEVGMPAYRIGASILSDFAVYCGDPLPASFWTTYWPSQISITEHASEGRFGDQLAPIRNHMGTLDLSGLRYIKSYDIINWFLEQPTKESDPE